MRYILASTLAALVLGGGSSAATNGSAPAVGCTTHTAAFGWEANRLRNTGSNLVVPITQTMHLSRITVDYSMTRAPGTKPGWREVLAYVALDPTGTTGPPAYQPTEPGAPGWGGSARNGAASHGGGMSDRIFAQAILKNAYNGQLVREPLDYDLKAGDSLYVHMDAVGAPTDSEAQGSVTYTTC